MQQKGNTWSYGNHKAVGREKFKTMLESDPAMTLSLENDVRTAYDIPTLAVPTAKKQSTSRGRPARGRKKATTPRKRLPKK